MRNKAYDARSYRFTDKDAVLPDANIWLYLYGPAATPGSWTVTTYSNIFSRILSAGTRMFLDVLVLVEFINRFARLEMIRLQPTQKDFKAFRQSADFPPVAEAIETQVTQILMNCQPINHPFAEWNLGGLLKDFATGNEDCNDQLIAENCRKHGLALLTNDRDFTQGGISVFTANNKLLMACP
jgi:predicted nucleic acid-binding protein